MYHCGLPFSLTRYALVPRKTPVTATAKRTPFLLQYRTRCAIYRYLTLRPLTVDELQFSLSPNPTEWGANLSPNYEEEDDYIHNPDPRRDHSTDQGGDIFTKRGIVNLGCVTILVVGLIALLSVIAKAPLHHILIPFFCSAGYPIISHFTKHEQSTFGGFNLGGINASGQVRD